MVYRRRDCLQAVRRRRRLPAHNRERKRERARVSPGVPVPMKSWSQVRPEPVLAFSGRPAQLRSAAQVPVRPDRDPIAGRRNLEPADVTFEAADLNGRATQRHPEQLVPSLTHQEPDQASGPNTASWPSRRVSCGAAPVWRGREGTSGCSACSFQVRVEMVKTAYRPSGGLRSANTMHGACRWPSSGERDGRGRGERGGAEQSEIRIITKA
jgi:hypothetical protein